MKLKKERKMEKGIGNRVRKNTLLMLLLIPFSLSLPHRQASLIPAIWAAPNTISYQGRLRESGQPVSGTRSVQFKVFDAASAGTPVFDSDPQSIYISSGIFGYRLGSNKAAGFPDFKDLSWATSSYWLEISVGGNAMSPREQINAVPYAFMASTAASLNGAGNIQITGAGPHYILNGNTGIGTTSPDAKLTIQGTGSYGTSSWGYTSDVAIKSSEMADSAYHSILQLISVRQSLTTGSEANGFLGFTTIDDSNGEGMDDAGRIAVVNESGSSRNSPTALSFWTNPGGGSGSDRTIPAAEKMRITSTGNVGIGTSTPGALLHISSPSASPSQYLMKITTGTTNSDVFTVTGSGDVQMSGGIVAKYKATTNGAIYQNNVYNFDTKIYDTHNAVTTGAGIWKFTAPSTGFYLVTISLQLGGTFEFGYIRKNGSVNLGTLGCFNFGLTASFNSSTIIYLNKNDYFDFYGQSGGGGAAIVTTGPISDTNYICITKAGH